MGAILTSVGRGCVNRPEDVKTVQGLLNCAVEGAKLEQNGIISARMIALIDYFQSRWMRISVDGKIGPKGPTLIALEKKAAAPFCSVDDASLPGVGERTPITEADYEDAARVLSVDVPAIKAIAQVESKGAGFFPSGRPKILFEAHWFSRMTFHCFDESYPEISCKKFNASLYVGGDGEYNRLQKAMMLDRVAALKSASWGAFQIMGFNYRDCAFNEVNAMVFEMFKTEGAHIRAFINFIKSKKLQDVIRKKDWTAFAEKYNGPEQSKNKYDVKISAAYKMAGGE